MKPIQLLTSGFLILVGISMVVHFFGRFTLSGMISTIIGLMLVATGGIGVYFFYRGRLGKTPGVKP